MKQLVVNSNINISINRGGVHINWSEYISGQYTHLASIDLSPTPGVDALTPKEVEFACLKMASFINAVYAEERKQTLDPASSPKLLLDGTDLERFVASALLKVASQTHEQS